MSIHRFLAAGVLVLGAAAAGSAFAHAKLQTSDPQVGSALAAAPRQVRLKFNEALEPAFSKIALSGPGQKPISLPAVTVDKADPSVMTVPLPALATGDYRIEWTAMSHDGHKTKGELAFKVK